MKYKVKFEFYNELGEWKEAYLDNNGEGFTKEDAIDIARQLRENSIETRHVQLAFIRKAV